MGPLLRQIGQNGTIGNMNRNIPKRMLARMTVVAHPPARDAGRATLHGASQAQAGKPVPPSFPGGATLCAQPKARLLLNAPQSGELHGQFPSLRAIADALLRLNYFPWAKQVIDPIDAVPLRAGFNRSVDSSLSLLFVEVPGSKSSR
jgi:hypothetical protein